jgi:vesicle-fusing ATPase
LFLIISNKQQGRRLLILATTTQRSVLQQLDLYASFDRELAVPNVNTHAELASVLREVRAFKSDREMADSLNMLRETTQSDEVGVGIKRVLLGVETARQTPEEMVERFADVMAKTMASSRV